MKKILLLIVAPFVFFSALFADTVSQEEADRIVLERLNKETQSYTVYAKEGVQKEMRIITSTGELLEINYFCWVYYVRYAADTNQGRYLIVKEANGSLLEVDAKTGAGPEDLKEWREVEKKHENDISACGIKDPLQNLEWLREFCESSIEEQDIVRVCIQLYKVIGTDEHVFEIKNFYSKFSRPYSTEWKNCAGELIFYVCSGVPPMPGLIENFMKDKEFVAELFNYIMPLCGVSNPLQNIEWLKEFCESPKGKQDISGARIDLFYKSADEYVFRLLTYCEYASNEWADYCIGGFKNCAGEEVDFSTDRKTAIIELFRFDKQ